MLFTSIFNRPFGHKYGNRGSRQCHDLSSVVEDLECLTTDQYGVFGEEPGVMVPPLACCFSKVKSSSHMFAVVDENGFVGIYNSLWTGQKALVKDWSAHANAIFDVDWMSNEEKLVTASGDQTAVLWDVPRSENVECFKGHTSSVRSVAFRPRDNAVFCTGSRDGHIMIWDVRCNRKEGCLPSINTIRNAHALPLLAAKQRKKKCGPAVDSQQSVTVVVFQNDMMLVSAGAVDGTVKIWDLRKNYSCVTSEPVPRHTIHYSGTSRKKHGFSSLVLDSSCTHLYASCTDDHIYKYDLAALTPDPLSCFRGHQNSSFYVKASLSPDDQFLLSGSSDELAYLWQVNKPNKSPVVLRGHTAEVSDVAWSQDMKIVTLADDNTVRIWRINRRQSPACLGEVSGTAERTHKEIGISVGSEMCQPCLKDITPVDPKPDIQSQTPKRSVSIPNIETPPQRALSPSIKDWLKKSVGKRGAERQAAEIQAPDKVVRGEPQSVGEEKLNQKSFEPTVDKNTGNETPKLESDKTEKKSAVAENKAPKLNVFDNTENMPPKPSVFENTENISPTSRLVDNTENKKCQIYRGDDVDKRPKSDRGVQMTLVSDEKSVDCTPRGDANTVLTPVETNGNGGRKSVKRKLVDDDIECPSKKVARRDNVICGKINFVEVEDINSVKNSHEVLQSDVDIADMPNRPGILKNMDADVNLLSPEKTPDKCKPVSQTLLTPEHKFRSMASPFRTPTSKLQIELKQSPTTNLPNLVFDRHSSVQATQTEMCKQEKKVDWLTKIRLEKCKLPEGPNMNRAKSVVSPHISESQSQLIEESSNSLKSPPRMKSIKTFFLKR